MLRPVLSTTDVYGDDHNSTTDFTSVHFDKISATHGRRSRDGERSSKLPLSFDDDDDDDDGVSLGGIWERSMCGSNSNNDEAVDIVVASTSLLPLSGIVDVVVLDVVVLDVDNR